MRNYAVRPEITSDAINEARRRLRQVPDEERRYSHRSNFGKPPTRYGEWETPKTIVQAQPTAVRSISARYEDLEEMPTGRQPHDIRPSSSKILRNLTNPFLSFDAPPIPPRRSSFVASPPATEKREPLPSQQILIDLNVTPPRGSPFASSTPITSRREPLPPSPFQYTPPEQKESPNAVQYASLLFPPTAPVKPATLPSPKLKYENYPSAADLFSSRPQPLRPENTRYENVQKFDTSILKYEPSPPPVPPRGPQSTALQPEAKERGLVSKSFYTGPEPQPFPYFQSEPQPFPYFQSEPKPSPYLQQQSQLQPMKHVHFQQQGKEKEHEYQSQHAHKRQYNYENVPPVPPRKSRNHSPTNPFLNPMKDLLEEHHRQQKIILARQGGNTKLPQFGGNPLDWPLFIQHYERTTEECEFSPAENCDRLEKALKDDAYELVRPLLYARNNPQAVIAELESRYGRPEYIIRELIRKARATPAPKETKLQSLLEYSTSINNLVITIESLEMPMYLQNPQLLQELIEKLPDSMKLQWGMSHLFKDSPDLSDFAKWVKHVANAASRVTTPATVTPSRDLKEKKKKTSDNYTLATHDSPQPSKAASTCEDCGMTNHRLTFCRRFKKRPVNDRWEIVKKHKLCFQCLRLGHGKGSCQARRCSVEGCNYRHHPLLHGPTVSLQPFESSAQPSAPPAPENTIKHFNGHQTQNNTTTAILRILPVRVYGKNGFKEINAIFDDASQVTMLDSSVAEELELTGVLDPLRLLWTDGHSEQRDNASRRINVEIGSPDDTKRYKLKDVRTVTRLTLPSQDIPYAEVVRQHPYLKGIKFNFIPNQKPLMLIGEKHVHLTVSREIRERGEDEPLATHTKLGWVLHGPQRLLKESKEVHTLACIHESDDDLMQRLVKESFALEAIGIQFKSNVRSQEDEKAENLMKKITKRMENRFQTGLLWKEESFVQTETDNNDNSNLDTTLKVSAVPRSELARQGHYLQARSDHDCTSDDCPVSGKPGPATQSDGSHASHSSLKKLPPSREVAFHRMLSLERRMKRDPELGHQIKEKIKHYITKGYARKLSKEDLEQYSPVEWYLPIFATSHPNKPGKIRIVWDAASRSNQYCLNDFLLTGPDLLSSLPALLLKCRQRRICFSGDITEMFHQVKIRPEDCPAQRFLWRAKPEDEVEVYQLEVMMFGSVCSPFCAQYVRNLNAAEHLKDFPEAATAVINLHYMDDYLDSRDTVEEACRIIEQVSKIHEKGGFEIGKWVSNSPEVLQTIPPENRASFLKNLAEWSQIPTERALGLHWSPVEDTFTYRVNLARAGTGIATGEVLPTKRAILRLVMLIWDPLGFLCHYTIKARIILQRLWRMKVGWDDEIPEEIRKPWFKFVSDLPKIANLKIPRCYKNVPDTEDIQLHVFADASEAAYCAVAYLRIKNGNKINISLVMAKSRVAPLKPKTIPRLELQAALCAARIRKFIAGSLDYQIANYFLWTDSMTVLRWIRNDARRYQQFVANRVGEIHEISEVSTWRWVPSSLNAADEGTREGSVDLNLQTRWFQGPQFLYAEKSNWPVEESCEEKEEVDTELRKELLLVTHELPSQLSTLPSPLRFSKYLRLVRATAYTLLAVEKFKGSLSSPSLPIRRAETLLFAQSQWDYFPEAMEALRDKKPIAKKNSLFTLNPVMDHDGVMRMKTRLTLSNDEDLRMPIILHPRAHITTLLVLHYHEQFQHGNATLTLNEIRQRFWVLSGKSAIKRIIRSCQYCRVKKVKVTTPPIMGDLPLMRLQQQQRPFTIVGVDYFGPLEVTVKRSREKRYGVLFTCLTTRAVHLEIAHFLTTDSCIMAIRRLIGRRGQPLQLLSDNGTNFRGADRELKQCLLELNQETLENECEVKGIKWSFSCPRTPHMTGAIERLVGSVKRALQVIMRSRAPRDEVLLTLFAEAEAIVNTRPLTAVSSDNSFPEALTPFHFLIGSSSTLQPPGAFDDREADISKGWRTSQALTNMFWRRWRKEYLPTLQKRTKWHKQQPNIKVGEVVVLFDESLKGRSWPLALVTAVYPSAGDGVVRVVDVKTETGTYKRPTIRLGRIGVSSLTEEETCASFGGKNVDR